MDTKGKSVMGIVDTMNMNDVVGACMQGIQSRWKNLKTLNIVVVGKSGAGKSTLINAVFREEMATTGIGGPVTKHMTKYTKKDVPLVIYDTKGFELGEKEQQEVRQELLEEIQKGAASKDINDAIHCIWYCVNTASNRFEPNEEQWIMDFGKENKAYQIPVIIVLTQSFQKKQAEVLKNVIEEKNLDVCQVIPLLARDYEIDENITKKAYGLERLIETMESVLPDELLDTFLSIQKASLKAKQKKSQAAVAAAAASAAVAGAAPIPFADAAVLIPIEITMMASVTVLFGFNINKSALAGLVSSVFGVSGATVTGKTIVSNLLKMIPGAGTLIGGAISGSTAALLTTALGEAYIGIMTAMYNGEIKAQDLETKEGRNKLKDLFEQEIKNRKKH